MLASQGYKESKNEEVNLPFTFYLVPFTWAPPRRFLLC